METSNVANLAKLKIIGVGGAGGNAINDMIQSGIEDVEFIAINTDKQDLDRSLAEHRVMLGKGQGAGADPEVARLAAKDSEEKIKQVLNGTDMVFITAGMGGGTGTGASPVIAEIAKEMGILTVAVVTKPFEFEGPLKIKNAEYGIENLKKQVDTLIVIPNQKLFELPNANISLLNAFKEANNVLRIGIKGISDLITQEGYINLDFSDIKAVTKGSGTAMLGFGEAVGEDRAKIAMEQALGSPLLEKSIEGARKILINITGGHDLKLEEIREMSGLAVGKSKNQDASLFLGVIIDQNVENTVMALLIATDFEEGDYSTVEAIPVSTPTEDNKLLNSNKKTEFIVPPFFSSKED